MLATDMEAHTEMVRDLGELGLAMGADLCSNMAEWRPEQRLLAMQMAVHCADIGNPAKPVATSMNWAARITSEFLLQACANPNPNGYLEGLIKRVDGLAVDHPLSGGVDGH